MSKSVQVDAVVDVYLDEISTEDLVEELGHRGINIGGLDSLVEEIWLLRRSGKQYDHLVDVLIYTVLGKVV